MDTLGWQHVDDCGACQRTVVACYRGGCQAVRGLVAVLALQIAAKATALSQRRYLSHGGGRVPVEVAAELEDRVLELVIRAFVRWPSWSPDVLKENPTARFTTFAVGVFAQKALALLVDQMAQHKRTSTYEGTAPPEPTLTLGGLDEQVLETPPPDLKMLLRDLLPRAVEYLHEAKLTHVGDNRVPVHQVLAAWVAQGWLGERPQLRVVDQQISEEFGVGRATANRSRKRAAEIFEAHLSDSDAPRGLTALALLLRNDFKSLYHDTEQDRRPETSAFTPDRQTSNEGGFGA